MKHKIQTSVKELNINITHTPYFGELWKDSSFWKDGIARDINGVEKSVKNVTNWIEKTGTKWDQPSPFDFLNELAYFGIIPSGKYNINISW